MPPYADISLKETIRENQSAAEALRVSEIFNRVSETGETGLADTLTNKDDLRKTNIKKKKESAFPDEADQKRYDDRGRELNEAV